MPLPKRSIEPVHVARSVYQQDELQSVELETVTNTTLTNIIRQLSSLSKHAEDVFGELARDVGNIGDRANSLQARIDRLAIKVTQLDSTVEEVPLTDITRKKAFKSAKNFDQQIFSRATMPAPMLETYAQCDKPPPLDKLNVYRDDGKDGLKFYTDPNYFFELWRQEMLKDTERVMHDKGKKMHRPRQDGGASGRGHKKRVRTPHNTRDKQRQIAISHGETLMPNNVIYRTPNSVVNEETIYGTQLVEIHTTTDSESIAQANPQQQQQDGDQQLLQLLLLLQNEEREGGGGDGGDGTFLLNRNNNNKQYFVVNSSDSNNFDEFTCMGTYDTRPPRPNSIELRRSYQSEQIDGVYGPLSPQTAGQMMANVQGGGSQYASAAYAANGMHPSQQMLQQGGMQQQSQHQQMYEDAMYHQSHNLYGQTGQGGPMSPEPIYAPGTPSRTKPRPSVPPPAPPSNGSGGGTPTASNANTPTRGRSMSTSRDALPPPPPIPDGMVNTNSPSQMLAAMNGVPGGSGHIAAKLLARTNSTSRAGSPQLAPSNSVQDANALVMAQLNNTINSFNTLSMGGGMSQHQQLNSLSDLPPPPPVPDQGYYGSKHEPKLSPPNAAPPPPPPPPPLDENGASPMQPQAPHQIMPKPLPNGDIQTNGLKHIPKKILPPYHDTRSDLMKSIRDGITLRKVEKSEQKEIERNTGLHDVASILARRVAIELSESEDSDSDDDSEGWMEPNETSA
ncbi:actin-binding protein WASF3 isoform X1 [Stomoxys calcitrans]|uniref:actin-binding protein WASF3 isoform X1 n=1 Tax=Stomoxys calcitrans TaxID=35570 RepID=UPI0027E37210|nr:actin-binding protein WASF3 isoform X1 [Stomoxys calcitrans]XP_059222135.1 actin-binding protein WASF3 isoform X1 [Stomoxys calcitrans]XP_059222136.1 actin-binding protein WASF3 isoform X1 [Stomoxys calcitrans]XP_059222137.1 actin-binding protein WASF3 isoform X1 [Stomoxys calcitrans]